MEESPEEWLSEQRRLGMVDLYDELEEFMDNNSDVWYGGNGDHWRRHM